PTPPGLEDSPWDLANFQARRRVFESAGLGLRSEPMTENILMSRREMLTRCGAGFGMIGLAGVLAADAPAANPLAPKRPHHRARAKHIINLYMNGGPSQVDTFDPKPALARYRGQRPARIANYRTENPTVGLRPSPFRFPQCGQSGLEISE